MIGFGPKVLTDFKKVARLDGSLVQLAREKVKANMTAEALAQFFQASEAAETHKKGKRKAKDLRASLDKVREANKDFIVAIDNQRSSSTGVGCGPSLAGPCAAG